MENIKNFADIILVLHKGSLIKSFSITEYLYKYTDKQINEMLFKLVCNGKEDKAWKIEFKRKCKKGYNKPDHPQVVKKRD